MTDIHLNFVNKESRMDFYQQIAAEHGDGILVTGDIAEALSIEQALREMANELQQRIYFVLGNHDYYHGSIKDVRQKIASLTEAHPHLFWLPSSGPQKFSNDVILLGHDCFVDGRNGNYIDSRVILNDSRMIVDLLHSSNLGRY